MVSYIVEVAHLQDLFDSLIRRRYTVVGPTLRDGAIVYDQIASTADLPAGWTDEQDGGTYRLRRRGDGALFGYAVGPHSWKKFLFPPSARLWKAGRSSGALTITPETPPAAGSAIARARAPFSMRPGKVSRPSVLISAVTSAIGISKRRSGRSVP